MEAVHEAIKRQFPAVKYYMFVGKSQGKRIKGQMFPQNVAVPVWEKGLQRLMKRLPYMKEVPEEQLTGAAKKKGEKAVRTEPPPIPDNWREAHHKRRIAWARQVSTADVSTVAEADAILETYTGQPRPSDPPAVEESQPNG